MRYSVRSFVAARPRHVIRFSHAVPTARPGIERPMDVSQRFRRTLSVRSIDWLLLASGMGCGEPVALPGTNFHAFSFSRGPGSALCNSFSIWRENGSAQSRLAVRRSLVQEDA